MRMLREKDNESAGMKMQGGRKDEDAGKGKIRML